MGAPSPELVDLWLARAFNAQDIEAAAAMYHPDARVVRLEQIHGSDTVAQGAEDIRELIAGYVGLKPQMDVVVHHTRRSRAILHSADHSGGSRALTGAATPSKSTITAWRSCAAWRTANGSSSLITPGGPMRRGQSTDRRTPNEETT